MALVINDGDLASYPGFPGGGNEAQVAFVLELVNDLILDILPGLVCPAPAHVRAIALEVASRPFRNTDGASSITKAVDDWTKTVRWEGEALANGVYLTDAEEARLRRAPRAARNPAVGSIGLRVGGLSAVPE